MDKKTGLVAFFDILGYQNFLKKNEPEIAADKIAELIKDLKGFQSDTFLSFLSESKRDKIGAVVKNIEYLVISDAILLTLETNKENKDYTRNLRVFLFYCSRLSKQLFLYGLPLRGAIEYGDYVLIEKQMFVGRPIVKAYQASQLLDLSACQVSNSVGDLPPDFEKKVHISYVTPLRTGEEKELVLLAPFNVADDKEDQWTSTKIPDLGQFIIEAFCAHGKSINREVQRKIINTEFFLRYCKARQPETAKQ